MIRRFLILCAAVMTAGAVHAQSISAAELAERLDVSEGTASAVVEVLEAVEREPGFLWTVAAELAEHLTAEQRAELLAAVPAARGAEHRQRMRGHAAAQHRLPMQQILRELRTLTPEQQVQLRQLHQQYGEQLRELAQQRRNADVDRDQLRQQRARLQREIVADVREILTPEQEARAQELIREMRHRRTTGERARRGSDERRQTLSERRTERTAGKARGQHNVEQRRAAHARHGAAREAALGLTAEQQAAVAAHREVQRERFAERRAEGTDRRQRMAQRDRWLAERSRHDMRGHGALSEILTEEQQTVVQLRAALARALSSRGR